MDATEYGLSVKRFTKDHCSCNGCTKRAAGCHGSCEEYKKFQDDLTEFKAQYRRNKKQYVDLNSYTIETSMKNNRRKAIER